MSIRSTRKNFKESCYVNLLSFSKPILNSFSLHSANAGASNEKKPPHHLQRSSSKNLPTDFTFNLIPTSKPLERDAYKSLNHYIRNRFEEVTLVGPHTSSAKEKTTVMAVPKKAPSVKQIKTSFKKPALPGVRSSSGFRPKLPLLVKANGTVTGHATRKHRYIPPLAPQDAAIRLQHAVRRRLLFSLLQQSGCLVQRVQTQIAREEKLAKIRQRSARRLLRQFLVHCVVKMRHLRKGLDCVGSEKQIFRVVQDASEVLFQDKLPTRLGAADSVYPIDLQYKHAVLRIEKAWLQNGVRRIRETHSQFIRLLEKAESIERRHLVRMCFSSILQAYQLFSNDPIMRAAKTSQHPLVSRQTSFRVSTEIQVEKTAYADGDGNSFCPDRYNNLIQNLLRYMCEADDIKIEDEGVSQDDILQECSRRMLFTKEEWKLLKECSKTQRQVHPTIHLVDASVLQTGHNERAGPRTLNDRLGLSLLLENAGGISNPPNTRVQVDYLGVCITPYFLAQRRLFESGLSCNDCVRYDERLDRSFSENDQAHAIFNERFIVRPSIARESPLFREYRAVQKINCDDSKRPVRTELNDSLVLIGYSNKIAQLFLKPTVSIQQCFFQPHHSFPRSCVILGDLWSQFLRAIQEQQKCFKVNSHNEENFRLKELCSRTSADAERSEEARMRTGKKDCNGRGGRPARRRYGIPYPLLMISRDRVTSPKALDFFIEEQIDTLNNSKYDCSDHFFTCRKNLLTQKFESPIEKASSTVQKILNNDLQKDKVEVNNSKNRTHWLYFMEQLLIQEYQHRKKLLRSAVTQHNSMLGLFVTQAEKGSFSILPNVKAI